MGTHFKAGTSLATLLGALFVCAGNVDAVDIGGTISSTLTITEDSQLVDDVTCMVTGAPCVQIGASHVTLELNGFTMTGQADAQTACRGDGGVSEFGIFVNGQTDVTIHGPGLVKQFRNQGILLNNNTGSRVIAVTMSTNCFAGVQLSGGAENEIRDSVSSRNGNGSNPCGGIWLTGGASRNRLRANRLIGNGYSSQGNNYGIGLIAANDTGNVIEENTVVGNTNGIFLAAGVQGNIIRRNLVMGNPPVQVDVDHSSANGWDIKNLADDGANTFRDNTCLTAINAPCPKIGPPLQ